MSFATLRTFAARDVSAFRALTSAEQAGEVEASTTETNAFDHHVVPSMLVAAMFTDLVAAKLPARRATVMGQMLTFQLPVYVGESVTATIEVMSVRPERKILRLATRASTARGLCIDGEAVVSFGHVPAA